MIANEPPVLPVSLIIVSDYLTADGDEELRRSLQAYAQDPAGIPQEIVIMLPRGHSSTIAADPIVREGNSSISIVVATHDSDESSQLKDAGLAHCGLPLVAVVEADCLPLQGWLASLFKILVESPRVEAVSGRTAYGQDSMMKRVMSLLDRGFIECRDKKGRILHVSNNGALYRRPLLERYRYPAGHGPFVSAHLRQHEMMRDRVVMEIAPEAVSIHAYEGLGFLWDVRRNKGFQFARMAGLEASNRSRIDLALGAVATSFMENRHTVHAVGRQFCRWTDWPLLWAMMLLVRIPEFSGALAAGNAEKFAASTKYR